MRSYFAFAAAFVLTALAIALPALSSRRPASPGIVEAESACTIRMHRKYDYSGRLYIQKVRVCRRDGGSA